MEIIRCFIPYCDEPVVRKGTAHWMQDSPVFVRAYYCEIHKYGGGMGVGRPMEKRSEGYKSLEGKPLPLTKGEK